MPVNDVIDLNYASGNKVSPTANAPFVTGPKLVPYEDGYVDNATTVSALATAGQLIVRVFSAANVLGGLAQRSAVAAQVLLSGDYGIVTGAATAPATAATGLAVWRGVTQALCTTTGTAIALGTLLAADGAGNLTVAPTTPTPGQLLARSLGTLAASTSTPTLVPVIVGSA